MLHKEIDQTIHLQAQPNANHTPFLVTPTNQILSKKFKVKELINQITNKCSKSLSLHIVIFIC